MLSEYQKFTIYIRQYYFMKLKQFGFLQSKVSYAAPIMLVCMYSSKSISKISFPSLLEVNVSIIYVYRS